MTAANDSPLFPEFDGVSRDQWIAAIEKSLRGRSLDSLTKRSYDGIDLSPIATVEDLADMPSCDSLPGQYPFRRGTRAAGYHESPWLIAQELDIPDPRTFNQALTEALANGQTAVVLGACPRIETIADLQTALRAIDLRQAPLFLAEGTLALNAYQLFRAALPAATLAQLSGCIGYDPLRDLALWGAAPKDCFERMAEHVKAVGEVSPKLGSIAVRVDVYHDAGASAAQELAIALATAVVYLRELTARGLHVNQVAGKTHFFLSAGENFFTEIAKLRALKMMWAQVARAFGADLEAQRIKLHARGARRNKSPLDVHNNILRATSEALAAALAGVDSITVPPFDAPLGQSDAFSRRLARNLQLILQEELRLTKLIDPAGGAWHIEKQTDQLAQAAWKRFQDIEAAGGLLAALGSGTIQACIEAVARQRKRDLAERKTVLVGSNIYPNLDDRPRSRNAPAKPVDNAVDNALNNSMDNSMDNDNQDERLTVKPLSPLRLADDYARLRQNAEDYRQAHGRAPSVHIIGMDRGSATSAKMSDAISVYAVGGFDCVGGTAVNTVEDALEAALSSRAEACVVCGSVDKSGAFKSFLRELQARKPQMVILAAVDRDADIEEVNSLTALGVADFVYLGGDCLALNRSLQKRLGVGK